MGNCGAYPRRMALDERIYPFSKIIAEPLSILRIMLRDDKRVDLVCRVNKVPGISWRSDRSHIGKNQLS